jgi:RimJ/RimL family protein N-acetyltransferase
LQKNGFELESIRKKAVIKNNEYIDDFVWVKFRS